ncbi:DUF4386 domain-containing protein [Patescibacteria group bacterium]
MESNNKSSIFTNLSQHKAVTLLRILYPVWAIIGLFSLMYATSGQIVEGDAAATVRNIMDNELLFRLGIIGSLITQLIHILVVFVLYVLFKAVNKTQAIVLVVLGLVGVPIAMLNDLNHFAVLLIANGADYLNAFSGAQLDALTMFFLELQSVGILIAGIFWGLWLFPLAYLIYNSGYWPRVFGILMAIGGIGYFIGSFIHLLLPGQETIIAIFDVMTFGEVIFMIWVLLRGAKLPETKS